MGDRLWDKGKGCLPYEPPRRVERTRGTVLTRDRQLTVADATINRKPNIYLMPTLAQRT
jgi:hypothetical protein